MATWFKSKIALIKQSYAERKRKKSWDDLHLINMVKEDSSVALINLELLHNINLDSVLDEDRKTLLHVAAEHGNFSMTCVLLERYLDVNAQDNKGQTPLMLALKNGHKGIIPLLINSNADIHIRDNFGKSALQIVCNLNTNCANVIAPFLNKVKQDCRYDNGKIALILISVGCPLRHATYLHEPEVIRIMLENGCPIDATDPETGQTALHVAFEYASSENIKLLLEYGANIDAMDFKGRLPYFSCGMWGESDKDLEITGIIMKKSKLLTTSDESGIIQIGNLLKNGRQGAVTIILRSNIDLCAKDSHGSTLMHYLALNSTLANNRYLNEELRSRTIDPNACDTDGTSALFNASMVGNLNLMELLLELGADASAVNVYNHTPLLVAMCPPEGARKRHFDPEQCVELLLTYGADLEFVLIRLNAMLVTFLNADPAIEGIDNFVADYWKRELSRPIMGKLALSQAKGTPIVIETIENAMRYDSELKSRFDKCQKQLEDLKMIRVYESLTLYDLLMESVEKVAIYARNQEFLRNIKAFDERYCFNSFYSNLLNVNLRKSIKIMEARKEIAQVLCEVMQLSYQSNPIIIDKIVSYAMC